MEIDGKSSKKKHARIEPMIQDPICSTSGEHHIIWTRCDGCGVQIKRSQLRNGESKKRREDQRTRVKASDIVGRNVGIHMTASSLTFFFWKNKNFVVSSLCWLSDRGWWDEEDKEEKTAKYFAYLLLSQSPSRVASGTKR